MASLDDLSLEDLRALKAGNLDAMSVQGLQSLKAMRATAPAEASMGAKIAQGAGNLLAGAVRGAGSIGATLLASPQQLREDLTGSGPGTSTRRAEMTAALQSMGADTESLAFKGGKLAGEIAGTAGAGGAIANTVTRLAPGVAAAAPNVINAIRTAGFQGGAANPIANLATRAAGGAITGGASAGLVNPEDAGVGALVGGALPGVTTAAGYAGQKIGRGILPKAAPEVAALAKRAQELGIEIPADRIVNSKPLNAVAASLNYVPFSGRAATEETMAKGLNKALSKTFGQNSDNVTQALRQASADLGTKFDTVLQANTVKMTPAFKTALADAEMQANSELGDEAASVIRKQIALIQTKGAAGEIDGQAAYNIKKALDRIGNGNSDAAFYARDLKKKLMDALNESLGPQEAQAFAKVRQQYGNMLALENIAQNGAEGGVSAARLANMKNINNPDLQELADIAAQFMRTRESPHGALQRIVIGGTAVPAAYSVSALPILAGGVAAGRGTNALLNSGIARRLATGNGQPNAISGLLASPEAAQLLYRAAPVAAGGR